MDINYELYKVFYYVATTLSFSEASKLLFISQSAVSRFVFVMWPGNQLSPSICTAHTSSGRIYFSP